MTSEQVLKEALVEALGAVTKGHIAIHAVSANDMFKVLPQDVVQEIEAKYLEIEEALLGLWKIAGKLRGS